MLEQEKNTVYLTAPNNYSGPKRSLVLAGGGMRVAYQAGVLQALFENNICFHHADGTSGGTMNLAMLLSGLSPQQMCDRWRTLDVKKFVSLLPFEEYVSLHKAKAMGDADGIKETVFPHLGIEIDQLKKAKGLQGTFNVCNYTDKTNETIPHQQMALELLVAGISLPIFMPAVNYNGKDYIDSVWIKDANLMEAVKRGAVEIWLIWCIGNHGIYKDGMFNQYVHMIEMSANGVLFEEFDRIKEINERIIKGDSPYGQKQPVKLHVIKPEYPLPLDPDFYFNRIDASTLVSMGYADAIHYMESQTDTGISLNPAATRMKDPVPGITFREKMVGWFAMDEEDPETGAAKGEEEGSKLTLHASIIIRNMQRFMEDEKHSGVMAGHLNFPLFDDFIPAKTGVFNLFTENGTPETKWMIYEMGFVHESKEYYLAGQKEVRDDPGFDLWQDTTTLKVTLREGTDKTGKIIGAGILKLELNELIRLVKSMHAIDALTSADKINLIANFGAFFMGELWDTYKGKASNKIN